MEQTWNRQETAEAPRHRRYSHVASPSLILMDTTRLANANDTSTHKVYKAIKHVTSRYDCTQVAEGGMLVGQYGFMRCHHLLETGEH